MNKKFTTVALTAFILLFTAMSLRAQNATIHAHYQFELNTADSSGFSYDAANNNVIYDQDIALLSGHAGHFSGVNSYLSLPNGWIGANNFIGFSLWFRTHNNVKPSGLAHAGLETIGNSPANWTPLMWIDSFGYLTSYYYDGSMQVLHSLDTVNDDQWHHAVFYMYYNGIVNQELWLDGVPQAMQGNNGGGNSSFANIYVGACNPRNMDGMPDAWMYFDGDIDEVIAFTTPNEYQKHPIFHNLDLAITEHPQDVNAPIGSAAGMHISHTCFNPDSTYTYQWIKNGMAVLIGQTDSFIDFSSVQWSDTGYYKCVVKNTNNFEVASYEGHLTAVPAGINPISSASQLKTYPNPANNVVYVDLEGTGTYEVSILNVTGQTIVSRKDVSGNARLDVAALSPGVYTIAVKNESGIKYSKFVKSGY